MTILEWALNNLDACDKAAYSFIQSHFRNPLFDFVMPVLSEKWNWLIPITGLFLYFFVKNKKDGMLLLFGSIVVILLVDAAALALKGEFLRLRPHQTLSDVDALMQRPALSAFPSNHAANSFALATLLALCHPKMGWVFFIAAALVAFSRVYLGDHYPSDVVAGAALGAGLAWAASGMVRTLRLRRPDKSIPSA